MNNRNNSTQTIRGKKEINGNVYWVENGQKEYLFPVGYVYEPSKSCLDNIKKYEGWHEGWQKCPNGHPTTGWGFIQTPSLLKQYPNGMTKQEADAYFFNIAIPERVQQFRDCMKDMMFYNQNQMDALFDLVYNIGLGSFKDKSPKLQKALKTRDLNNILAEMNHGENDRHAPGLKRRRNDERILFMTPIAPPKSIVRLTESDLHQMIKETTAIILQENSSHIDEKLGEYDVIYGNLHRQILCDCPEMGGVEDVCLYSDVRRGDKTYALYHIYGTHKYFFTEWIPQLHSDKTIAKKIKIADVPQIIYRHAISLIQSHRKVLNL